MQKMSKKEQLRKMNEKLTAISDKLSGYEQVLFERWNKMNDICDQLQLPQPEKEQSLNKIVQTSNSLVSRNLLISEDIRQKSKNIWKELQEQIVKRISDEQYRKVASNLKSKEDQIAELQQRISLLMGPQNQKEEGLNRGVQVAPTTTETGFSTEDNQNVEKTNQLLKQIEVLKRSNEFLIQYIAELEREKTMNLLQVQLLKEQNSFKNQNIEELQRENRIYSSHIDELTEYIKIKRENVRQPTDDSFTEESEKNETDLTQIIEEYEDLMQRLSKQVYEKTYETYLQSVDEIEGINEKVSQLMEENNILKDKIQLMQKEEGERRILCAKMTEDKEDKIKVLQMENKKLRSEVDALKNENINIQDENINLKNENIKLKDQIQKIKQNFEQRRILCAAQKEKKSTVLEELEEKIIQLQKGTQELTRENQILKEKIKQMEDHQENKEKLCAAMTEKRVSEVQQLREEKIRLEKEVEHFKRENEEITERIKQMIAEQEIKTKDCKRMTEERIGEIQRLRNENIKQMQEIQYLKNHHQMMADENKQLEKELTKVSDQLMQQKKEKEEVTSEYKQIFNKYAKMSDDIEKEKKQKEELQQEYKIMKEQLDELKKQHEQFLHKNVKKIEKQVQTQIFPPKLEKTEKVQSLKEVHSDGDNAFIDDGQGISEKNLQSPKMINQSEKIELFKSYQNQTNKKTPNKSKSIIIETPIIKTEEKEESHNNFMNHQSNSVYNADMQMLNLSQENKKLRCQNSKLHEELKKMSESVLRAEKLGDRWITIKREKKQRDPLKLVQSARLKEKIELIMLNKQKVLKELDHHEFEALCEQLFNLIEQTKEWVQILDNFASEGKKNSLITHPKLLKRRTHKIHHYSRDLNCSKSVCSQGDTPRREIVQFDVPPFEMEVNENNLGLPNCLQRMFSDPQELSEISSVKHQSQNSDFLHSKSEIVKILEKQMKIKKDIIDEYAQPISNKFINQEKDKKILQLPIGITKADLGQKFEEKSTKSQKKVVQKTVRKFNLMQKKLQQTKKEYKKIIDKIVQQYENKIKKMQDEFRAIMEYFMKNQQAQEAKTMEMKGQIFAKSPSKSATDLHSRYSSSSKDTEVLKEKNQELEKVLILRKEEIEKNERILQQKTQIISELEKKYISERSMLEKIQKQYQKEKKINSQIKHKNNQMRKEFGQFMNKLTQLQHRPKVKVSPQQTQTVQVLTQSLGIGDHLQVEDFEVQIRQEELATRKSSLKSNGSQGRQSMKALICEINKEIGQMLVDFPQINEGRSEVTNKELPEILKNIHKQIKRARLETIQKFMSHSNSLNEIIKEIIVEFKISYKFMDKIIKTKESNYSSMKYIQLRQFLKALYKEQNIGNRFYESFEGKQSQMQKQMLAKQQLIEEKRKQLEKLSQDKERFLQLKKNISNKSLASQNEQFYDFIEKKQFDNTKPIIEEIQLLKKELHLYKEKCKEYENSLHPKKKQIIYIRK